MSRSQKDVVLPSDDEFMVLVSAACDGTLTSEELPRLESRLRTDETARRFYIAYLDLHSRLLWRFRDERTAGPVLSVDAGRSDAMGATSTAASDRVAAADADGVRRPSPTLVRLLGKWGQRGWHSARRHAVALSIVGVLLAIGSLAWVSLRHRQPDIFPAPVANGGDNQGRTPLMVARLATADGRLVGSAAALTAGAPIVAGQRLLLASGRAEVVFPCGAEIDLLGPVAMTFESDRSVKLASGHLTVRAATVESRGFTVSSRTAVTTDVATEFSIAASSNGYDRIAVANGTLDVQMGQGLRRRLHEGETITVQPGRPSVIGRVELGDGKPIFGFPTIQPPVNKNYADTPHESRTIQVACREPYAKNSPLQTILDRLAEHDPNAPHNSMFFAQTEPIFQRILLDAGKLIPVKMVNTYSWYLRQPFDSAQDRAVQSYTVYGSAQDKEPPAGGNLAAAGWTLIADVETDQFFDQPRGAGSPLQQGVSITAAQGGLIGTYRYLLWDIRQRRPGVPSTSPLGLNFCEFDVFTNTAPAEK